MYDIIGDIHGYCSKLKELLLKLGYSEINGIYQHPERKLIFVGDYIDRGPEIRETLQLIRSMVEADAAIAIMGNHEYNAVAFAVQDADGGYLRSHNAAHKKQHQATLDQFAPYPGEWQSYIDWFYTLPLFLDLGQLRVVHACWDADHIIALVIGGDDDVRNMAPAHVKCHRGKTDVDVTAGAEAKRRQAKHIGAKAPSKWQSRGFGQWEPNIKYINSDIERDADT